MEEYLLDTGIEQYIMDKLQYVFFIIIVRKELTTSQSQKYISRDRIVLSEMRKVRQKENEYISQ